MSKKDFKVLLEKYLQGTLSPSEDEALRHFLHDLGEESYLNELIDQEFEGHTFREQPSSETSSIIFQRIMEAKKNEENQTSYNPPSRKHIRPWLYAAAAIVIMLVTAVYYYSHSIKNNKVSNGPLAAADVAAPDLAKASIILSDGTVVLVDSASEGTVAQQGNASIIKLTNGDILYKNDAPGNKSKMYNVLTVPRGSKVVTIRLSDGTKVWLNAASTLKYPVSFDSDLRKVEASGELYFEVSQVRNAQKQKIPFIVDINDGTQVDVLGTHFNIHAYPEEPLTNVTLIEGSVKVSRNTYSSLLQPGQQAQLAPGKKIEVDKQADVDQVTAWKNGYFQFEGADIQTVMSEISRWYDVDITYEGKPITEHFRGSIARNVSALSVFQMLEATGVVHFKIEGRNIVVIPKVPL